MILVKRINHNNGLYSSDYIFGGYEYKVNNQLIVSTLNDATLNYNNSLRYSIHGNFVLKNNYIPLCTECNANENRLQLTFSDPIDGVVGSIGKLIIRKILVDGQEALSVILLASTSYYLDGTNQPQDDFLVPSRDYILLKQ